MRKWHFPQKMVWSIIHFGICAYEYIYLLKISWFIKKYLPNQVHNPPRQARFHFLCPDMRIQNNSFNHVLNTIKVFENITKPSKHLSAFIKSTLDLKDCSYTSPFACFQNVQTWEIYFIALKHWKYESNLLECKCDDSHLLVMSWMD